MKNISTKLVLFFLAIGLIGLYSCKQESSPEKIRVEATQLYYKTKKLEQKAAQTLENLVQQKNSINIQGRELTPQEINFVDQVEVMEIKFSDWQKKHKNWNPDAEPSTYAQYNAFQLLSMQKDAHSAIETLQKQLLALQTFK